VAHFSEPVLDASQSVTVHAGLTPVRQALGESLNLYLDRLDGATRHRLGERVADLAKLYMQRRDCFFYAGPSQCFDLIGNSPQLPLKTRRVLCWRWCCPAVERAMVRGNFGDRT